AIATEGYFTPEIKGRIDDSGEPWRVIIEVTPGPRTIVREIDLDFFGPAVDDPEVQSLIEDARANWSLNVGEPFRQAEWAQAKRRLLTSVSSGRYAAARITHSEALIDPETQRAELSVAVSSGPVFHFGQVEVTGLQRYEPWLVENFSPLRRQEPYSA